MIKDYVNDKNLQIAMTEYDSEMDLDHVVKTQRGDQLGTVTQVYNNTTGAGEQVYAVVENSDEEAEDVEENYAIVKNPKENAEDVEEVTVLFRGSTGPDHIFKETADVWNDWAENDFVIGTHILKQNVPSDQDQSTEQLKASARVLKDIMEKYPNAKINIYGHSLGSMDAQYAMADLEAAQIERIQQA